jgi:GT2 family glycosyltransferase
MLSVYVIILNWNKFDDTKRCIESLKKISYKNAFLIIVDNASSDDSYNQLSKEFPSITLLSSPKNKGYAGGMNIGIEYALSEGADFILLTNNDMTYSENFLEPLVDLANNNSSIGIVSPKVLYMHDPGLIYCAGGEFKLSLCGGVNTYQGKESSGYGNEEREITLAEGSCLLVKKEVFETIGLIDEKYFMYFEDLDFSNRVRKYFKIYYTPKSKVYHKTGAGIRWSDFSPLYYFYYTRNRLLFFSQFNIFIKFYVILFACANSIAKTIVLSKNCLNKTDKTQKSKKAINSLWKGTIEGLKIIVGFKN